MILHKCRPPLDARALLFRPSMNNTSKICRYNVALSMTLVSQFYSRDIIIHSSVWSKMGGNVRDLQVVARSFSCVFSCSKCCHVGRTATTTSLWVAAHQKRLKECHNITLHTRYTITIFSLSSRRGRRMNLCSNTYYLAVRAQ